MSSATLILADSRAMVELADGSVHLALTSPPYWSIKDYGRPGQIGHGQSLHDYLADLHLVWAECFRVLAPGRRLVVNIGDQFVRAADFGRYKVVPLHAEVIAQAERIGFDYLGAVIWQKKTTLNPSGGGVIMGSFPHPPNGVVELDYEFILLFRKPGRTGPVDRAAKAASALTKAEWKECFAGHWRFAGVRQRGLTAVFPEELPRRLIKMFSFVGEVVLDPFLGSGTTLKAALDLGRRAIGYELNPDYLPDIRARLGLGPEALPLEQGLTVVTRPAPVQVPPPADYHPAIADLAPAKKKTGPQRGELVRVKAVLGPDRLGLADGRVISFLGVRITDPEAALAYLHRYLLGREVSLEAEPGRERQDGVLPVYVKLKNRIFVNTHLLKAGLAVVEVEAEFKKKKRFVKLVERLTPVSEDGPAASDLG